jgi:hypothetical protein
MSFRRNVAIIFLALTISCACPTAQNAEAELALEVVPVKSVFQIGEKVDLNFVLRNVGHSDIVVARTLRLTASIKLDIADAQGQLAQWCGRIAEQYDSSRSYVTLAPGQSISSRLSVSCVNEGDKAHAWGYAIGQSGTYVIKATYRLPRPKEYYEKLFPNAQVVRGPVAAEPITIELK